MKTPCASDEEGTGAFGPSLNSAKERHQFHALWPKNTYRWRGINPHGIHERAQGNGSSGEFSITMWDLDLASGLVSRRIHPWDDSRCSVGDRGAGAKEGPGWNAWFGARTSRVEYYGVPCGLSRRSWVR